MAAGSLEDTRTLNDRSPQIHRSVAGPMAGRRGILFQKPRGNNFRTEMQIEQGGKIFLRNGTFRKHRQVNYLIHLKCLFHCQNKHWEFLKLQLSLDKIISQRCCPSEKLNNFHMPNTQTCVWIVKNLQHIFPKALVTGYKNAQNFRHYSTLEFYF